MSLAKKCDKCGNLYEPEDMDICGVIVNAIGLINRDKQNFKAVDREYLDLCPECLVSFSNWLKNKPMTFNEIRKGFGLEPIKGSDGVFVKLCSEKENKNDQT